MLCMRGTRLEFWPLYVRKWWCGKINSMACPCLESPNIFNYHMKNIWRLRCFLVHTFLKAENSSKHQVKIGLHQICLIRRWASLIFIFITLHECDFFSGFPHLQCKFPIGDIRNLRRVLCQRIKGSSKPNFPQNNHSEPWHFCQKHPNKSVDLIHLFQFTRKHKDIVTFKKQFKDVCIALSTYKLIYIHYTFHLCISSSFVQNKQLEFVWNSLKNKEILWSQSSPSDGI